MSKRTQTTERLIEIIEPVCADGGYELVDVDYTQSPSGWVVRVFIDHAPQGLGDALGISFDDCERLSRELSAVLDVEDPIPHAYSLEVSSPGLDRPLRTAAHFRRFSGEVVKISLERGIDGGSGTPRRNFKGRVVSVDDAEGEQGTVEVDVDGTVFRLPIADMASAKLVPNWDELMKQSQGKRA